MIAKKRKQYMINREEKSKEDNRKGQENKLMLLMPGRVIRQCILLPPSGVHVVYPSP